LAKQCTVSGTGYQGDWRISVQTQGPCQPAFVFFERSVHPQKRHEFWRERVLIGSSQNVSRFPDSQYISRREWQNAGEYVDTGFSGAKASRPALDGLMADAAKRKFDCVAVWKIDRFGRSVLHLNQQLAALTSHGVRFIATSQSLDTDEKNPTSRLLLQILGSVAEFEREMIRERTLSGIRVAQAAGKVVGRPKRVFRRDEVVRLRDVQGLSWRAMETKLGIPAMTALDSYRQSPCTETVSAGTPDSSGKRKRKTVAA